MKKQLAAVAVASCIAVGLAFVAHGFGGRGKDRGFCHGSKGHGPAMAEKMLDKLAELGATEEQIKQVKELAFAYRKQMIDLRADVKKAHLNLWQSLENAAEDTEVMALVSAVSEAKDAAIKGKFQHLLDVRSVLGPDLSGKVYDEMKDHRRHRGSRGECGHGGPWHDLDEGGPEQE